MNKLYDPIKLKLNKVTVFIQPYCYGKCMAEKFRNEVLKSKGIKVIKFRKKFGDSNE